MKDLYPRCSSETDYGFGQADTEKESSRKDRPFGTLRRLVCLSSSLKNLFMQPKGDATETARYGSSLGGFEDELFLWMEKLKTLNSSTEKEFLSVGSMLQLHYQQAKDISITCSSIVDLMRGEDVKSAIQGLQEINERVMRLEHQSKGGRELLHRILESLEGTENLLKGFGNIVRTLNLLCVSTRIEDARFSQIDTGFGTLSDDIRRLAVSIEEKSTCAEKECESLKLSISQALFRVLEIESKQRSQAELILNQTGSNLAALRGKYELSSTLAEGTSEKYEDVSRSIGEIVASMQFHDITRQRFEHVGKALGDMVPSLRVSESAVVGEVCELQMLQLEQSGDMLIQAVHNIIRNLQNTAQTIRELSDGTLQMSGAAGRDGESFLANIEGDLSSIASVLCEYSLINEELSHATRSAADKTVGMSAFVRDIEKMGLGIKLIALNAIVKATHIGEEGKALSTLAEAIHHLSGDTGLLTDEISRAFMSIASMAQELSTGITIEGDRERSGENPAAEEMRGLIGLLHRVDIEAATRVRLMEESGSALIGHIDESIRRITVHEEVSTVVEEIISGLSRLAGYAKKKSSSPGSSETGNKLLEKLATTYTMDSERLAHERLSRSSGLDTAGTTSSKPVAVSGTADNKDNEKVGEDLGDNVELF